MITAGYLETFGDVLGKLAAESLKEKSHCVEIIMNDSFFHSLNQPLEKTDHEDIIRIVNSAGD